MPSFNDYSQYRRQSFRLQGYDYRRGGMYFVTICTKDRLPFFGKIVDNQMILSDIGQIVYDNWYKIPQFSPHIVLDEFVVMPNHIHGILAIISPVPSLQCNNATAFAWQPKFYDRIIRNEQELYNIQNYIINNPKNWKDDENYF
ncbi:transposase [Runella zeae]|uniref:transposase n=1 Tax=Runella zeae TaxID=94255 RepID=UPI002355DDB2|nr:transposase [Runella zeae]